MATNEINLDEFDRMIKRSKQLFSYRPCIRPSASNIPRFQFGQLPTLELDTRANRENAVF